MEKTNEDDLLNVYSNKTRDVFKIYKIAEIISKHATETKFYQNKKTLKYLRKFKKNNNIITFNQDITPRLISLSIIKFIKLNPNFNTLLFYYLKDQVIGIYEISIKKNDIYIISYAKTKIIKEAMDLYRKKFNEDINKYYTNLYLDYCNIVHINSKLNTNMFSPQSNGNFNLERGVL